MFLYLDRLKSDHDGAAVELRKAVTYKEAARLHACCGAFLFLLKRLQQVAPEGQFGEMQTALLNQFMSQFLDSDLMSLLETQVPAGVDLNQVRAFRTVFSYVMWHSRKQKQDIRDADRAGKAGRG